MEALDRATTESSQKMAAPPLVPDAGKKKKFPLEGPAIPTANVLSMMASFVSENGARGCRGQLGHRHPPHRHVEVARVPSENWTQGFTH
jgi:hypothetical protein